MPDTALKDGRSLCAEHEEREREDDALVVSSALLVLAVGVTIVYFVVRALSRGQDWSFDSHSYHNVYGYAMLFERDQLGDRPLALGAYLNPVLDIPLGWGVRTLDPRVVTAGLATVQAGAIAAAALLPCRYFAGTIRPPVGHHPRAVPIAGWIALYIISVVVAFGTIGRIELGATQGDLTSVLPAVLGAHVLMSWSRRRHDRQLLYAGALFSSAVALKYTNGPALVGALCFVVATVSITPSTDRRATEVCGRLGRVIAGAAIAATVVIGPWWFWLTIQFGNPLFPFGGRRLNPEFVTADGGYLDLGSHQFVIRSMWEFIGEPVRLLQRTTAVTELPARDPRLFISAVCCLAILTVCLIHRQTLRSSIVESTALAYAASWIAIYSSWAFAFGNGRYFQILELLTPLTVTIAAVVLLHRRRQASLPLVLVPLALTAVIAVPLTVSPDLNHVPFGAKWYDFDLTNVPPLDDAMVIVPYEFEPQDFAIFVLDPRDYVRLNNALLPTRLADSERTRISDFDGPIYSFEGTDAGDQNLANVGLRQAGSCVDVPSYQGFVYRLCELERE